MQVCDSDGQISRGTVLQPHCKKGTPPVSKAEAIRNKGHYLPFDGHKGTDTAQLGSEVFHLNISYSKHTSEDCLFWQFLSI